MKLDQNNQIKLMQRLRYIAEKHTDDITANAASDLAFRMESMSGIVDVTTWDDIDQQMVDYALTI